MPKQDPTTDQISDRYQQHCDRLIVFIQRHLPLINTMDLQIQFYDGQQLSLSSPLALNHNDKGTAFGGSLYNLCLMNTIGLAFLKCFEHGLNPDLVVGEATISYQKPVKQDLILSHCEGPSAQQWDEFFQRYDNTGKAKISLRSAVTVESGIAAEFSGVFALIGESETSII